MKIKKQEKFAYFISISVWLIILLALVYGLRASAALPPTTLRGAKDPTNPVTFFFQAPNNMVSHNGSTGYVSQVQKNWLKDPDFMDSDLTKWTISDGTQSKDTSIYLNNGSSRKIAVTFLAGTYNNVIFQQFTTPIAYPGVNFEGDIYVYSSNPLVQYRLCFYPTANAPGSGASYYCTQYVTGTGSWQKFSTFYPGLSSGTQYTFTLDAYNVVANGSQSDSIYVSDSYFGPAVSIVQATSPNTFTAQVSSAGVISNQTPSGITWLSSCSASTGNIVCTPTSGFFTSAPNCTATPNTAGGSGYSVGYVVASATASSLPFALTSGGTSSSAFGIIISCTKTGPNSAQAAVSPNQATASWSGYQSGASWSTTATGSFADITGQTIAVSDFTKTNFTTPTQYSTSPGLSWVAPNVAPYEVCLQGAIDVNSNSYGIYYALFDGSNSQVSTPAYTNNSANVPLRVCAYQIATTANQSMVTKLRGYLSAAGVGNIYGTITWSIKQIGGYMNVPILTGSITSNAQLAQVFVSARINNVNGSSAFVSSYDGNWIAPSSCSGTGVCTYTMTGFSQKPDCTCSTALGAATICDAPASSATSVVVGTYSGASVATNESGVTIMCKGPR